MIIDVAKKPAACFMFVDQIVRQGKYGPGFVTIMKSWPDLRDTPPHPRKTLDDNTIHQHRVCIEASSARIRSTLDNVGTSVDVVAVTENFGGRRGWVKPHFTSSSNDDMLETCLIQELKITGRDFAFPPCVTHSLKPVRVYVVQF